MTQFDNTYITLKYGVLINDRGRINNVLPSPLLEKILLHVREYNSSRMVGIPAAEDSITLCLRINSNLSCIHTRDVSYYHKCIQEIQDLVIAYEQNTR